MIKTPKNGHYNPHKKAKSACDYCRLKKVKCDEQRPCSNCNRKGIDCCFNPEESQHLSKLDKVFGHLENKIDILDSKITKLLFSAGNQGDSLKSLLVDSLNSGANSMNNNNFRFSQNDSIKTLGVKTNIKQFEYGDIFTEDDSLLSSFDKQDSSQTQGGLKSAISPSGLANSSSIYTDSNSIQRSGSENPFLDEIFDPDSKDPYIIEFLNNSDPFEYTSFLKEPKELDEVSPNSSNSITVMNISSLIDNQNSKKSTSTDCFGIPTPSTLDSLSDMCSATKISLSTVQSTILREDEYSLRGKLHTAIIFNGNLNLTTSHTEMLLESYLDHIYPFYPIVCETIISRIKSDVSKNGLVLSSSSCQYLLVLALGEITIADECNHYWSSKSYKMDTRNLANKLQAPPGFQYFWSAIAMFAQLRLVIPIGFDTITIQLLLCVYYLKICQLNDLKRELLEGADMLFHFLELEGHEHKHRDLLLRLYWVFLHLERALFNMKLLDHNSSLLDVQPKVSIPKGCKSKFAKDANTFYSNCFMQNILLANIDDKVRIMMVSIDKTMPIADSLKIFMKFQSELDTWRELLPFGFHWEENTSAVLRSTFIEMDLLKMRYYLDYVTVCQFMIRRFDDYFSLTGSEAFNSYKELISKMIEKSLSFVSKAQVIFNRQHIVDLDPLSAYTIMNALFFVSQLMKSPKFALSGNQVFSILNDTIKKQFVSTKRKLQCFALHSKRIDEKLEILETSI